MPYRLAVPDQLSAFPAFRELESDTDCDVVRDTPSKVGIRFASGDERFDAALITPLDYARHGGSFRILPGIGVSVAGGTGASLIRIGQDTTAVASISSDLRSTYDLALATLLLREKFPGLGDEAAAPKVVPVADTLAVDLAQTDAVLDWYAYPPGQYPHEFAIDVYEEWVDLTEAPLVLLLWVVREDVDSVPLFRKLATAFQNGVQTIPDYSRDESARLGIPEPAVREFFHRHTYTLTHEQVDSIDTLFRVAYAYGMIGDIPDILFLEPDS